MILLFLSISIYAQETKGQTSKLNTIKNIGSPKDQYVFYVRSSIYANNYVENKEDWIAYFEARNKVYSGSKESVYINFILVHLYRISSKINNAIDLGLTTFYNNKDNQGVGNLLLCRLLQELETCYYLKNNNLELVRLNKEKFKICGKNEAKLYQIYFNMGLYDLALKDYREHINYGKPSYKQLNLYMRAFHNNNFGVYFMYDNKIDSALYYYRKADVLFKKQIQEDNNYRKADTEYMLGVVDGNIATCYLNQGKYKQAIPLYLNEIEASKIYYKGKEWTGFEKVYQRIALCYIHINKLKKAKYYIKELKNFKSIYYQLKSEYHSKLNNSDSTLYFNRKYITITDSIFNQEMKAQKMESLGVLEANNKLKSQEKQISLLEEQDSNKTFQIKLISVTSAIVFFLLLLLLYFYYDKIKKQKIVESQKNEIEIALNNNKTLLKELNHRVKNNLQMVSSVISLQASKIKDDDSKKHFNTAINRVKVLSKIHNSLYSKDELNEIDLLNYVTILKNYLVKSIINPEINVDFKIEMRENIFINNDTKTTIGLIINELITNSFKYAFNSGKNNLISISIHNHKDNYHFSYIDNGKGFDLYKIDKTKSIGLNLVLRLVNQLGEEAEIDSNNGFKINFRFKG